MLLVIAIALGIPMTIASWVLFDRAGKPAWAALVPVYNFMVAAEIGGRPGWHGVMALVPFIGPFFGIPMMIEFARSFGKTTAFGVGTALLGPVFLPMLVFSGAKYEGPVFQG